MLDISEFKELDNDRLIKDGEIAIIIPKDIQNFVPLICSICNLPNISSDDLFYHREYGCCEECGVKWAEARQKEWKNGWRPASEIIRQEVELRLLKRSKKIYRSKI